SPPASIAKKVVLHRIDGLWCRAVHRGKLPLVVDRVSPPCEMFEQTFEKGREAGSDKSPRPILVPVRKQLAHRAAFSWVEVDAEMVAAAVVADRDPSRTDVNLLHRPQGRVQKACGLELWTDVLKELPVPG